jgi:hypothetical protein
LIVIAVTVLNEVRVFPAARQIALRPRNFQQRLNFSSALLRLASEDATVHRS